MALFTETVTGGVAREVYGGLVACDAYILDMIGDGATAYQALITADSDDARKRLLISATRYIDRQRWEGTANGFDGTTLAFPRDDLEDEDGDEVSNADQLALVEQAVFELVAILAADADVTSSADQGSNIKSMGAGSARLEFFSPTKPGSGATKLPTAVHELLGDWLLSTGAAMPRVSVTGGVATGTDGCPSFEDDDDADLGGPL